MGYIEPHQPIKSTTGRVVDEVTERESLLVERLIEMVREKTDGE